MELNLILLLLSFTALFFPSTLSSQNSKYDDCSKKLQSCGNIEEDIGYPFYDGSTRPEYCGHPGFKLDCQDPPQINISGQAYNILKIDTESITVSRTDSWVGGPCPTSLVSMTMDFSRFNFSSADQNITFFYDCDATFPSLSLNGNCNIGGSSFLGYYLTPAMMNQNNELNLPHSCKSNLVFPILNSEAEAVDKDKSWGALIEAYNAGFELGVITDIVNTCNSCTDSDGECGYNSVSNKFVCHCADADYDIKCRVNSPPAKGSRKGALIGISVGVAMALVLLLGGVCLFAHRRQKKLIQQEKSLGIYPAVVTSNDGGGPPVSTPGSNGLTSSQAYTTTPSYTSQSNASYMSSTSEIGKSYNFGVHVFDYTELEIATNNFDESKELGDGGFGTVYYGVLRDGRCVAVKRLYENSAKRKEQFKNEIKILATLEHRNLVRLYGCTSSSSRDLLLVYEYIANGTVAEHLHGKFSESTFLRWPTRLNIAVETAEALTFLHGKGVIHRDVKTTNILLDDGFHVKVADFGLSREFSMDKTHVSTAPQGTPGYVDPEYYQCYRLTEKSDVYSFGVVLIELISSKLAVDITRHRHDVNLASMAVDRIQNQMLHELVDPRLEFDKDPAVQAMVRMVAELGFQCLQPDREMRPTMDGVVARLRAVQLEGVKGQQKQEVLDIIVYGDDVGLLTNPTPPLSPELPRSNDVV